jgi:hypothetical protein
MAFTVPIFHGIHNHPVTFVDTCHIDNYPQQAKNVEKLAKFTLSPQEKHDFHCNTSVTQ